MHLKPLFYQIAALGVLQPQEIMQQKIVAVIWRPWRTGEYEEYKIT